MTNDDKGQTAAGGQDYSGRLELTWTNKHLRLLAHEDGSYQWLPPSDYRVSEVRLLRDAGTLGKTHDDAGRAKDNLLIRGDALHGLTSLARIPEVAGEFVGKVRLAYLDPPFNTQQAFEDYDDALEHSVWLTMMRDRLALIKELLTADGSVWVHCDDSEQAYLKAMMDEVYGRDSFVAAVIWQKLQGRENRTDFSTVHDYILVYAKEKSSWAASRNLLPFGPEQLARYKNPDDDPRGPWQSGDISGKAGPGRRAAQFFDITLPSGRVVSPPPGRCWVYTEERFKELSADNRIWFGREGDGPIRIKQFLSEVTQGLVPNTLWLANEVGVNTTAKKEILSLFPGSTPFATPKPEALLQRIIEVGSKPEDVVLDCFVGSGTTCAVAHKMGRRWIGIEWSAETLEAFAIPRLARVVDGTDPGGVTKSLAWQGGGGFRILDVAPSMFEEDGGAVVLAEWAVNSQLAEATAAQLGYEYEMDPPFCGRKGRARLAVVDGLVNEGVVELLVQALPEGERLVVCGTGIDPSAREVLRELRPGSTMRRIPASILEEYRRAYRRFRVPSAEASGADGRAPIPLKQPAPDV